MGNKMRDIASQAVKKYGKENVGHPLITDKNQHRLDYIEFGEGLSTGTKEEQTIISLFWRNSR
jgi:hypothetical protein|tara:strand:- start:73 stop:261 length:189 start_codon:yes stop_codon:yes gene_type:complete